jgi:hypothetical protein
MCFLTLHLKLMFDQLLDNVALKTLEKSWHEPSPRPSRSITAVSEY